MMQRRSAYVALGTIFWIVFGLMTSVAPAQALFDACRCTCIDPNAVSEVIEPADPPKSAGSCAASVCPAKCAALGSSYESANYNPANQMCGCRCLDAPIQQKFDPQEPNRTQSCSERVCPAFCEAQNATYAFGDYRIEGTGRDACYCGCLDRQVKFKKYTPGNSSCSADCSAACGGPAAVHPDPDLMEKVQVGCLTHSDCTTGQFRMYKGVACVQRPTADGLSTIPICVIPPTRENADIECKEYGGPAKGGTCSPVSDQENPLGNYFARPYLDTNGVYRVYDYQPYTEIGSLIDAIEGQDSKPPQIQAGLCYLFGLTAGVTGGLGSGTINAQFFEDIQLPENGPTGEFIPILGPSGVPKELQGFVEETAERYVCAKRKLNTCGTVIPGSNLTIKLPFDYSCIDQEAIQPTGLSQNNICFPDSGQDLNGNNYADLCANDPGKLCCAGTSGACVADIECSLDGSMKCVDGRCEFNPICDPEHEDRRCRPAVEPEISNQNLCTPEFTLLPQSKSICPDKKHHCCNPPDPAASGSCAADVDSNSDFSDAMSGRTLNDGTMAFSNPDDAWKDFTCIPNDLVPDSEYTSNEVTGTFLNDWRHGGNCIPADAPVGGGTFSGIGSQQFESRCAEGRVCCSKTMLEQAEQVKEFFDRPEAGQACPGANPRDGFTCKSINSIVPDDLAAQERGFVSRDAYIESIAHTTGICQITPQNPGWWGHNAECFTGSICCRDEVNPGNFCGSDEACNEGVEDCDTEECPMKCDSTKLCLPADVIDERLATSGQCVGLAQKDPASTVGVQQVLNVNPDTDPTEFGCQYVTSDTPDIISRCINAGCDSFNVGFVDEPGQVGEFMCCIPGVGESPGEAALAVAEAEEGAGVEPSAFTIGLPPCIKTGKCTLNDIIQTGINFANFLIGLSGSIFLLIFVYAGFLYLTAATSDRAQKGKKMIVQATVAMVLLLGAFVIVSFIESAFVRGVTEEPGGPIADADCIAKSTADQTFSCQFLESDPANADGMKDEILERGCETNLCGGPANRVCCPVER